MTPETFNLPITVWREGQYEACLSSIASRQRFVGHVAPPGTGKTWMLLGESAMSGSRTLILLANKELQNAYCKAAKSMGLTDVRGKSNYYCKATEAGEEFYDGSLAKMVDQGPCQSGEECYLRENGCIYYDLVRRAKVDKLVISNYAAYISSNLYTEGWGYFPLVMLDEAHEIENKLTDILTIELSNLYRHALNLEFPDTIDPIIWANWAADTLPFISELAKEERKGKSRDKKVTRLKVAQKLEQILVRMRLVTEDWIVTKDYNKVLIQPIWVDKYAESLLYNGAKKVVFASATMNYNTLSPIGVEKSEVDLFEYPSSFPVERRPVYYYPVTKMHHGMDAEDTLAWINVVDDIIEARLDRKGIIHTVSFSRQQQLIANSRFSKYMIANAKSVDGSTTLSLQKFRAMRSPAIMVTPSMTTGVSLDGKQCEYTIIPKIPFENIVDPLYIARSREDLEYGVNRAAQILLQAIGRPVRSETDQAEAFILDQNFDLYIRGRFRKMLPKYFWDSVRYIDQLPPPLVRLE